MRRLILLSSVSAVALAGCDKIGPTKRSCLTTESYWDNCIGVQEYAYLKDGEFSLFGNLIDNKGDLGGWIKDFMTAAQNTQFGIYEGEWADNRPHGQGTLKNDLTGGFLTGEWRGGRFVNGRGKQYGWTGLIYEGEFRNGLPHGKGTSYDSEGKVYHQGEFEAGIEIGDGPLSLPQGQYDGPFRGMVPHGKGTLTLEDGVKVTGTWVNGSLQSIKKPTNAFSNQYAIYVGEYKDGQFHGNFYHEDGGKGTYVGGIKDDNANGQGSWIWANGAKYVGEVKDGDSHGQGTLTYPDGGKYVGDWKDGKQHGQGTMTALNGVKYVGGWKDGVGHGQGTLYKADGSIEYQGEWCNNEPGRCK